MWIVLVLIAALVLGVLLYNGLVSLRERVDASWSDIDVQLKRRYDLIPNLVETVKGYAQHEEGTLERVIAARSAAMSAEGPEKQAQAENILTGTLRSLFALSDPRRIPTSRPTETSVSFRTPWRRWRIRFSGPVATTMQWSATTIPARGKFLRTLSPPPSDSDLASSSRSTTTKRRRRRCGSPRKSRRPLPA